MTDTPKRFPYGGGPSRWVNPRAAVEQGFEVAELPRETGYAEPAYDVEVDDGSPSLRAEPGADLDFEAAFGATAQALDVEHTGAAHLARQALDFTGWECDCKATAKTGIPPRHFMRYCPADPDWPAELPLALRYKIMVLPGKGEIKQARGEGAATGGEQPGAVECPSWRWAPRIWQRPVRDWSKSKHAAPPAPEPAPVAEVEHPAGVIEGPEFLDIGDPPRGCTARSFITVPGVTHRLRVRGRRVDDGSIVTRFLIAGRLTDGTRWVGYWTDGKFDGATIGDRPAKITDLRRAVKDG